MVKFRGALKRAIKEYKYYTVKGWSYEDCGKFWDSVKDYDEIDDETYAYKRRFYDSIKMVSFPDKSRVLDIDARTGNGLVFYNKHNKIKSAVCVSPSEVFLNVCKERTKKYKVNVEKAILLRKMPLPLKSNSFDAILCLETVEHVSNHIEFLSEINRLLKDNGELVITMPNILWEPVHWLVAIFGIHHSEGPHNFLRRKKILRLLRRTGFRVVKERTTVIIPSGPRWLTKFGEKIENFVGEPVMKIIGLRRIFICRKVKDIKENK